MSLYPHTHPFSFLCPSGISSKESDLYLSTPRKKPKCCQ